jgi:hypothetical protein
MLWTAAANPSTAVPLAAAAIERPRGAVVALASRNFVGGNAIRGRQTGALSLIPTRLTA